MTTAFGDRMSRLWNRADQSELRSTSLGKGQVREQSRTPPKNKTVTEQGDAQLPKNLKEIFESWQCQECSQESDTTVQAKICKEPGCPQLGLRFHAHCKKTHNKTHTDENKMDATAPLNKRAREVTPTSEERTLRRSGSSSDGGNSTCIPDTDTVASFEAHKGEPTNDTPFGTEAVYLGIPPKAKAPPPLQQKIQGGRQANGPEGDSWTCRLCTLTFDKKHFVSCLICHQNNAKCAHNIARNAKKDRFVPTVLSHTRLNAQWKRMNILTRQ